MLVCRLTAHAGSNPASHQLIERRRTMKCPKCKEGVLKVDGCDLNGAQEDYIEFDLICSECKTDFFARIQPDDIMEID